MGHHAHALTSAVGSPLNSSVAGHMASVRKREWTSPKGEAKSAWVVDYFDQAGKRRLKTFARKKEADAYVATAVVEVRSGVHTPDSQSITVADATKLWLASCGALERTTVDSYRNHVELHINPYLGRTKLSQLTGPLVRDFEDKLRKGTPAAGEGAGKKRSAAMVKRIVGSLGFALSDSLERGLIARNVVRDLRGSRKRGKDVHAERRQKGQAEGGRRHPDAGRGASHRGRAGRQVAADPAHRHLCRPAGLRAARVAVGRHRPAEARDPRPATG